MVTTFPVNLRFNETKNKYEKVPALERGVSPLTWTGGHGNSETFGINIPDGVLIVDLDTKDGKMKDLQEQCEKRWGCAVDWESSLVQTTPSGGNHHAFLIDWDARQTQDKDRPYDTRVGGKGWIASGHSYEDVTLDGIVETLSNLDMLPKLAEISELVTSIDVDDFTSYERSDVELDDIKYYLEKLQAHDPNAVMAEDTWHKVGQIISFETQASDEGKQLFIEWSKNAGELFNENEIDSKWQGWEMGKGAPARFGSLVYMAGGADKAGEREYKKLIAELETCPINDIIDRVAYVGVLNVEQEGRVNKLIKERYKSAGIKAPTDTQIAKLVKVAADERTGDWLDEYVATATGDFIHKNTGAKYNMQGFNLKNGGKAPSTPDGGEQSASMYAQGRVEVIDREVYEPMVKDRTFEMDGLLCLNTYNPGGVEPDGSDGRGWESCKAHLHHLFEDEDAELLLYYLAHNVQFPGKLVGWSPVLKGCQGDGKSYFGEMMTYVLGLTNVRQLDPRQLTTNFSGWAEGQVMSFVEEVRVTQGRFDVMNAFKPYVTNRVVDITAKGKDPKSVPNRTNYLFCTNFEDALPLKDGDRRFAAFKTKWQVRADLKEWETGEGEGYYKKLYSDMREDAESIKWGLLDVDIPQWFMDLAVAPETRGTKDMIHASKSQSQRDIESLINEYELSDKAIRLDVLKSYADEDDIELPKTGALTRAFEDAGYPYRKRLKIDGALVMVYMKNDYDNEDIRALLR